MKILKFFAYIACYIFYPFSYLFPRTDKLLVFGSYRGAFNDNSKYLFLYANEHLKNRRVVWVTTSKKTAKHVRNLGYEAYSVASFKGFFCALRAKYWFVNTNTADILFCLSGGATVVNLWHGVPMKAIEFGITEGDLAKRYQDREFWEVFYHPACFRRPDYMVSTTDFFDEVFARCFRIRKDQCLQVGCPRNRMLQLPIEQVKAFVERYESEPTKQLIQKISQYDEVFVYMPTWRDSQRNWFAGGIDLDAFNECLKKKNAFALMKPHVNTIIDKTVAYSNMLFIDGRFDMYCILPFTDVLITDYSSILYDYILMPEKKVILFHYDYEEYVRSREFLFPIEDNIVGRRAYSFEELLHVIETDDYEMDPKALAHIREMFWGKSLEHDICASILEYFHLNE